jgi:hypothetical protein
LDDHWQIHDCPRVYQGKKPSTTCGRLSRPRAPPSPPRHRRPKVSRFTAGT